VAEPLFRVRPKVHGTTDFARRTMSRRTSASSLEWLELDSSLGLAFCEPKRRYRQRISSCFDQLAEMG
jgi:hypothetical protein